MQDPNLIHFLTFHGLGPPGHALPAGEENYWLDAAFFEEILDYVRDRPNISITFDDANLSDFTVAFPALTKRNMKAGFYVVSERIDRPWYLATDQIREMAHAGMGIGSHGTKHRPWATLGPDGLEPELKVSRSTLECLLGAPVVEAACPYGSYNRRVLHALRAAGYQKVYTSDGGAARRDDWLTARNTIQRIHTMQHVEQVLQPPRRGLPALLRSCKLTLKRWR